MICALMFSCVGSRFQCALDARVWYASIQCGWDNVEHYFVPFFNNLQLLSFYTGWDVIIFFVDVLIFVFLTPLFNIPSHYIIVFGSFRGTFISILNRIKLLKLICLLCIDQHCVIIFWEVIIPFWQSLLCDPNPNSPANSEAARMFSENKREYNRRVREVVEQSWTAD
jgi:hypothetical protein